MRKLILTIVAFSIWATGQACSCAYKGNFLKVSQYADIVAIVKVKDHQDYFTLRGAAPTKINKPLSATFEVIQILKGEEDRREVKVFGDDGVLCRPYIDNFKIEQYYIVGLFKCGNTARQNGINETEKDYYVNACGEYWLNLDNDQKTVTGLIEERKEKTRTVSLDVFMKMLKPD